MKKLFDWVKYNFQFLVIVLLVLFVFSSNNSKPMPLFQPRSTMYSEGVMDQNIARVETSSLKSFVGGDSANLQVSPDQRMTVDDNYISLTVDNVNKSLGDIKQKTLEQNGFVVNMYVSKPQEATNANISVRVPKENAESLQAYIKALGVKVVTESMSSNDVTDQFRDLETELNLYLKNQAKFEQIMEQATLVQDILQVQNELLNIQRQIDSVKGQKQYIEQTANSVKFTVYLSTDEYSLPYVPNTSWRPDAIFKESVRSLVLTFREIGSKAIWLAVYSVIWAPILLVILYFKKRNKGVKK